MKTLNSFFLNFAKKAPATLLLLCMTFFIVYATVNEPPGLATTGPFDNPPTLCPSCSTTTDTWTITNTTGCGEITLNLWVKYLEPGSSVVHTLNLGDFPSSGGFSYADIYNNIAAQTSTTSASLTLTHIGGWMKVPGHNGDCEFNLKGGTYRCCDCSLSDNDPCRCVKITMDENTRTIIIEPDNC